MKKVKIKIALAIIVKGDDKEADFLESCLSRISPFVDGIFITITNQNDSIINQKTVNVAEFYNAIISHFKWINDFSAARNFNWSQVPKEYDYILWCDADDSFWNLEDLDIVLKSDLDNEPNIDAWTMQYYYDRDRNNNPTVVHTKTQIVKNDGCVTWVNRIHEDFKENREIKYKYIDSIKRIHLTTAEHVKTAFERNIEISKEELREKPDDPLSYFNLGNAYFGIENFALAKEMYLKFLETSSSDAQKYVIYQRLSAVEKALNNKNKSIEYLLLAVGMYPEFPDALNQMGYLYYNYNMLELAEKYLLIGLVTKPQYHRMIVYNPRDYDYNPMMALAKLYFKKSRPDLALPMLKGCLDIYPDDPKVKGLVADMEKENERLNKVVEAAKHIETLGDNKEKILYVINKLPIDLKSHPAISRIRNQYEIKETSTGKDIAYYCGETQFEWNPELFKIKGFGGSEEAVINLSKEWVKQGYNVTVYNSCGVEPMICDGVTYKPWWTFNGKDKWDHLILWRSPILADYELKASNIYVDLHDVIPEGEFTEKRLKNIKKIMVKTNAHRVLFPNIPDEKFAIIPNGMDFELFNQDVKRDPYLLINTSSPDRSMDVLPKLFMEVKKRVPKARLKWAYGWDNFDQWFGNDKRMMDWKEKTVKEMKEAGIEDMGRLSQKECAKLYLEGTIFAYPSDFYEIDCISVKKAQACGCLPATTDFAAMKESNQYGYKVHTERTIKDWALPYQIGYGTKDEKAQKKWIDAVVDKLKSGPDEEYNKRANEWSQKFAWSKISGEWIKIFK